MKTISILFIEDDPTFRNSLGGALKAADFQVYEAVDIAAANVIREKVTIDLVLLDLNLPCGSGMDFLRQHRLFLQKLPVIVLTGNADQASVTEAIRLGAYDYLTKGADDRAEVFRRIEHALRHADPGSIAVPVAGNAGDQLIGKSSAMVKVFKTTARAAPTNLHVLITGEPGVGKELIARAIYEGSARADKVFAALNCAAIAESVQESELFGHEKDAFTGANQLRVGRFEECDGGTLFLDEIGETALSTQAKLLRVLQEKELTRVGGNKAVRSDVRLIAATNRNLQEMIADKTFRQDLYDRLSDVTIAVPPLRERRADIPLLFWHFLGEWVKAKACPMPDVPQKALDYLCAQPWPGNVRQLRQVVQGAALNGWGNVLDLEDFLRILEPSLLPSLEKENWQMDSALMNLERTLIILALDREGGDKKKAAARLGILRDRLYRRIKELGIPH